MSVVGSLLNNCTTVTDDSCVLIYNQAITDRISAGAKVDCATIGNLVDFIDFLGGLAIFILGAQAMITSIRGE